MNNSDVMAISQFLGSINAQVQTNFNGLVQMTEADNVFKKDVYTQFKKINETLAAITDKLGITPAEPTEPQAEPIKAVVKTKAIKN